MGWVANRFLIMIAVVAVNVTKSPVCAGSYSKHKTRIIYSSHQLRRWVLSLSFPLSRWWSWYNERVACLGITQLVSGEFGWTQGLWAFLSVLPHCYSTWRLWLLPWRGWFWVSNPWSYWGNDTYWNLKSEKEFVLCCPFTFISLIWWSWPFSMVEPRYCYFYPFTKGRDFD